MQENINNQNTNGIISAEIRYYGTPEKMVEDFISWEKNALKLWIQKFDDENKRLGIGKIDLEVIGKIAQILYTKTKEFKYILLIHTLIDMNRNSKEVLIPKK